VTAPFESCKSVYYAKNYQPRAGSLAPRAPKRYVN
jgi:hypothetical protein